MWSKTIREFCNSIKVINACAATTLGGGVNTLYSMVLQRNIVFAK